MAIITLEPYIPLALWVPLALCAAGLLAWYAAGSYRRLSRRRWLWVMVLMSVAVAVPMVMLLNPVWLERIPPPAGKPLLTVLVDHSASMETRDAEEDHSRYEQAQAIAEQVRTKLEDRYEVRIQTFAGQDAPGDSTDLAGALSAGLGEDRPQGQAVLLVSDGIHNAPGGIEPVRSGAARAKAMAAPVYTKTLGTEAGVRDLEVSLGMPQELAFVGQQVPVVVTLRQRGSLGVQTRLELIADGKVVEGRDARLVPDGTAEELFHVAEAKPGVYRYEVRAVPLAEEVTPVNNTATLVVRVVDQPVRVLLLEGKPYWDTKFLVRTLSTDRSIELTSVVRMAEGRFLKRTITRPETDDSKAPPKDGKEPPGSATDGTPAKEAAEIAPRVDRWSIESNAGATLADPDALDDYQIVILGRESEIFLSDEALVRLKKWLTDRDGSLVCFRGPPASQINQRLGELMPVRWTPGNESRFRVEWTGAGEALRWLPGSGDGTAISGLPPLSAVSLPQKPAPLAIVLAASKGPQGESIPVISYQPLGTGRVVVVEGAGMWRWAFLPPAYQQRDETYGVLWRSLVRWLVANVGLLPSQKVALRTDKVTFSADEPARATLLVRQNGQPAAAPDVELSGGELKEPRRIVPTPSGSTPGQFRVALGRLGEGRYQVRIVGAADEAVTASAAFDVRGNLQERLDVAARPDVMRLVADQSGGAVLDRADPAELAAQFDRHLTGSRPERIARTTAWDRWWVLIGAFGLWATAWGVRRWSGLV